MTNCSDEFPKTDVLYHEISDDGAIIATLAVACLIALICMLIYVEEIVFLLPRYKDNPSRITSVIVILGLFPVVCVLALISLLVPTSTVLTDLLASCYLSYCVYTFVAMTIAFFGGEDAMVKSFKDDVVSLRTPPCCCCCCCILKPIKLTRSSLFRIKLCSLQVIIVRPLLLFIGAILWTDGKYDQTLSLESPYAYISLLSGISTLFSVYGMIVIFRNSRLKLQHYSLTLKFIPVQVVVILMNVQNVIFNGLAQRGVPGCVGTRGPRVRVAAISHSVLVLEMFLLSLLARRGYRRPEHEQSMVSDNTSDTKQEGFENPVADGYGSFDKL